MTVVAIVVALALVVGFACLLAQDSPLTGDE